ncbi:pre-mRNA-splicing helicase BRR2 [Monoraphidium neglectum]|uniref:Pre-mRNA-splicing helicase BRR2 n=1 Tax=Monoraphidium neglectum TaxID=145388 RepID=A0A0D2N2V0_9CHLO|nr:pre-mRNA-splicing helicase BRR2 [Monoraphidium neglectum]KIZ00496.1 pre-mRNA-splicing helicase BRR2 [Monoraphidium neglectum]|eukprot:XP_013899515.1 pre-mRNA-splicing helicase BRR2 [Monoraphidium neglectum]
MDKGGRKEFGAGAEGHARFKQYDYRANSSLVLTSDVKRDAHEPTGEPETLAGRNLHKMGDRVQHTRPEALTERKERSKKREAKAAELEFALPAKSRKTAGSMSVMDLDTAGFYRPRTKETRAAYEAMLNVIHTQFGDQPQDVLRGAADEVLAVLKNQHLTDPARQKEVNELLGPVADERFAELVAIGKLINDWVAPGAEGEVVAGDTLDQEIGVAVEVGWLGV